MTLKQLWVRCQVCHLELPLLEDEPKALYIIPAHPGLILNPCSGSGLTTAYHAHRVVAMTVPNSAESPKPPAILAELPPIARILK